MSSNEDSAVSNKTENSKRSRSKERKLYCLQCGTLMHLNQQLQRYKCTSCSYVHYRNPIPVVAGIVEYNGNVVLVQSVGWPSSWFGLVTGFLEYKEDPEEAVLREVNEELGIPLDLLERTKLIGVYPFSQMNQVIIAYHIRVKGEPTITIDKIELAQYKLVPINEVKVWNAGTGWALRDWLQQVRPNIPVEMIELPQKPKEEEKSKL